MSHSLSAGKISFETLNARVATVLAFVQRVARACPDVVYGDGEERTADSAERRAFCRRIAAEGIVLLKNSHDALPIQAPQHGKTITVAVIGPNAKMSAISGGGSAALKPTYVITPLEGIVSNAPPGVEVSYATGCYSHKFLPTLEGLLTAPSGAPGWTCQFFKHKDGTEIPQEKPLASVDIFDTRIKLTDFLPTGLGPTWSLELLGTMLPDTTGPFEFGLIVAGRARLYVDGKLLIDNWTRQWKGEFWYGCVLHWSSLGGV
jgi:beta-glucosidase